MNIHLAKILVKESIVSLDQIRAAFEEQKRSGKRLGEVLVGLGYINESQLVDFLSKEYGVPAVNLDEFDIEAAVLSLVPRKTVLEHGIIPIGRSGSTLVVAMSDPSNIIAVDDLRFATGFNIKPVVAPERAIKNAVDKHYGVDEAGAEIKAERDEEPIEEIIRELEDFKKSVHKDNATFSSRENAFEKGWKEVESEESYQTEVLTPTSFFSQGHEFGQEEDVVSQSVEEKVIVNPFVAPSSSQNYEVAGEKEEVIPEKGRGDGFDPGGLFSEESELQQQAEEVSLESGQEEEALKSTSSFSQGFESAPQPRDSDEATLELKEEVLEPFVSSLSKEDEFSGQNGELKSQEVQEKEIFNQSSLSPQTNVTASSQQTHEEKKGQDSQTVIPLHREVDSSAPSQLGVEKEQEVRPTILVVDDSSTVQKIIAITLERKGYRVFTAASAIQALAKLNEVIPNLILLDITLPHMDGYQVCKIIKANDLTKDVPVIMLSGKEGFFDKVRGRLAGATDYIKKPFDPSTLMQVVKKYAG